MLGSIKLTKNADPYKCNYSGYDTGFDFRSVFSLTDGSVGKDCITFEFYMGSSVHIDNKRKHLSFLGKCKYLLNIDINVDGDVKNAMYVKRLYLESSYI